MSNEESNLSEKIDEMLMEISLDGETGDMLLTRQELKEKLDKIHKEAIKKLKEEFNVPGDHIRIDKIFGEKLT